MAERLAWSPGFDRAAKTVGTLATTAFVISGGSQIVPGAVSWVESIISSLPQLAVFLLIFAAFRLA